MKCAVCGEEHDELPDICAPTPFYWRDELEGSEDSLLTDDLCIVDGEDFFIRGVLKIPLIGGDDYFGWGVWVSQKKENFETYQEQFDSKSIGPFFGWLATEIDWFPESTLNVPTTVRFVGGGSRPLIDVNDCDHPLRRDQQSGIKLETAWQIVHHYIKAS